MTRYRAKLETTVVVSRTVELDAADEQEAHDRLWKMAAASGPDLRRRDWRIERAVDEFVGVSGLHPVSPSLRAVDDAAEETPRRSAAV